MKLSVKRWNSVSSEKDKILFLHGLGGTGALWRPLAAVLESDFSILAPDQRGHGKSILPTITSGRQSVTYTPMDYGRDILETLTSENFYPTWVVGHSMGVRSACALAHLKPEFVKGLCLIDLGLSGMPGGSLGAPLASFLKKLPTLFTHRNAARDFMNQNCPDPAIAQYLMAVSQVAEDQTLSFPFDHSALIQTIEAARDTSVRKWVEALAKNKLPVLLLRGENSLVWTREDFEAEKAYWKNYPSVQCEEMRGCGHGLPFEKRLEFVKRIKEWMGYSI